MKGEQLALGVQLSQAPGFDNFFAGPNAATCDALRRLARARGLLSACLVGGAASGKTHLLRAAVAEAAEGSLHLGLRDARAVDLAGLEQAPLLALDDVDAGSEELALPLLRLIDARRARSLPLLVSSRSAPAQLAELLADLRTRLSAMALLPLRPLRDEDRQALLQHLALERGLELPEESTRWLISHLARDPGTLIATMNRLDAAALSQQRRLTLPFVQQVLRASGP